MSVVLDVAIGISFLYLLLALIVTTVQELLATWLRLRANNLYQAIADMLATRTSNGGLAQDEILYAFTPSPKRWSAWPRESSCQVGSAGGRSEGGVAPWS